MWLVDGSRPGVRADAPYGPLGQISAAHIGEPPTSASVGLVLSHRGVVARGAVDGHIGNPSSSSTRTALITAANIR